MPAAYHDDQVTQQWSLDIAGEDFMRTMRLKQKFLDLIKRGQKTLEVRVGYDSIKTVEPGERIRFVSRSETQVVRLGAVRRYETFAELLRHENPDHIAPGWGSDEVLRLLGEIYPPDREKLGVVVRVTA